MKKHLRIALAAATLLAALGSSRAAEPASTSPAPAKTYEVKIDNFSFGPATLTVPVGSTVTWTNQDDVPHTIVSSDDHGIKSPVLDTDQKFSYTFTAPGTYSYYCSVHPKMTAKVVVQ